MLEKRFGALVIDLLVVFIPYVASSTLILSRLDTNGTNGGLGLFVAIIVVACPYVLVQYFFAAAPSALVLALCTYSVLFAVYVLYCIIMQLLVGKTIGQRCQKIITVNGNDNRMSGKEIIKRNILKFIFMNLFIVEIIYYAVRKRFLYESLSNTYSRILN